MQVIVLHTETRELKINSHCVITLYYFFPAIFGMLQPFCEISILVSVKRNQLFFNVKFTVNYLLLYFDDDAKGSLILISPF